MKIIRFYYGARLMTHSLRTFLLREMDFKASERNVIVRTVLYVKKKKSLTAAAPTKIRFTGWSSPFAMGGHNRGDWESGENWRGEGAGAGEKGKKSRILIHDPCSLTSRGNEVENRTLLGSTHLFFTFHEDTNVGFRALLRFPDISNVSESRSGFSRQPSARKLYQTANERERSQSRDSAREEKRKNAMEREMLRGATFSVFRKKKKRNHLFS